mgnify:CR=1 FL=1|jgi:hypothetical protein
MAKLSPATLARPGKGGPTIFIDKIWKFNGRNNKFEMVGGSEFVATGCVIGDWEYDAKSGASATTLKKYASEAKKALIPGVRNVEVVGKIDGKGTVISIPVSRLEKSAEFGGQGGASASGKLPANAATTRAQEKGSTYIFQQVLGTNKKNWVSVEALKKDKATMKALNAIWQKEVKVNVNQTWLEGYWKQHKKMLDEFGGSKWTEFDHSGPTSFMNFISDLVNKKFGISQKDNWNPADMWLITSTTQKVKATLTKLTEGSKATQTINELNAEMRRMYLNHELVGISLKAISGKLASFEEYNVSSMTTAKINKYKFPKINLIIDLSEDMSQDSKAELRDASGSGGFNFQIKSNSSTSWAGLKWESTPKGASAARGGKAQVASVIKLLDEGGQTFQKDWSKYPINAKEFAAQANRGSSGQHGGQGWLKTFEYVYPQVETKLSGSKTSASKEFQTNIEAMFNKGIGESKVANSKLMQLKFLYDILKIKETKNIETYTNFWTDLVFLSIKLGNQYGPFGKLY